MATQGQEADRREVSCRAAASLRAAAAEIPETSVLVGFDGFVDVILDAVRMRRSMAPNDYERIATIGELAERIAGAAGVSGNIELVRREVRFGGNGPLLASGLARLGAATTLVGCVECPDRTGQVHPLFTVVADRCRRIVPLGPPGHTDAIEFTDGKIMLNQTGPVQLADWGRIVGMMGLEALRAAVAQTTLIGIVNWSLCGGVEGIWEGLATEVLPRVGPPPGGRRRRVYVDLSDPAKRTDADVARALSLLGRLSAAAPVTLGLNLAESRRIASVLGIASSPDEPRERRLPERAAAIRDRAALDAVVIHPREGAAGASADGACAWVGGPLVREPRLSTGAGDHFNAGAALAMALGLGMAESLAVGVATSGAYVRDAVSPALERVLSMLDDPPEPEDGGTALRRA